MNIHEHSVVFQQKFRGMEDLPIPAVSFKTFNQQVHQNEISLDSHEFLLISNV